MRPDIFVEGKTEQPKRCLLKLENDGVVLRLLAVNEAGVSVAVLMEFGDTYTEICPGVEVILREAGYDTSFSNWTPSGAIDPENG